MRQRCGQLSPLDGADNAGAACVERAGQSVDGSAVGAVNRVPMEGEARSNLHVGGSAVATGLTARDLEICERIGPELLRRGLLFVGIDVIGDYLTEINVTSPTGVREILALSGIDVAALTWDAIEAARPSHVNNSITR